MADNSGLDDEQIPLCEDTEGDFSPKKDSKLLTQDNVKGVIALLVFAAAQAVSTVSVQLLKGSIPELELNAWRQTIPIVLVVIILASKRKLPTIPWDAIKWVILLILFVSFQSLFLYISVEYLPGATAHCLYITAGITLSVILFRVFLEEKINLAKIASVLCAVIGIFLVLQPKFLFSVAEEGVKDILDISYTDEVDNTTSYHTELGLDSSGLYPLIIDSYTMTNGTLFPMETGDSVPKIPRFFKGFVFNIIAAFCNILYLLTSKYTNNKGILNINDKNMEIIFWIYLTSGVLSVGLMVIFEHPVMPSTALNGFYVAIHSLSAFLTRVLALYAVTKVAGQVFTTVSSSTCVFLLYMAQVTFLRHILPGKNNWIEALGVTLVAFGTILASLIEILQNRKK